MTTVISVVIAILFFGLMIFLHELGHFIAARIFGVTVHEFSIGMGPRLFGWGKHQTKYSFRLFPIGGYVKLEGEDSSSSEEGALSNKPAWQRLIILISGALMNVLLGLVIFVFLSFAVGVTTNQVAAVLPDSPAETAGIQAGDEIVRLNQTRTHFYNDISFFLYRNGNAPLTVTYRHNGTLQTAKLSPMDYEGRSIIGFQPVALEHPSLEQGIRDAGYNTLFVIKVVYVSLWDMIRGKVGMNEMSGPVGIVSEISKSTDMGAPWLSFLYILDMMGLISINLGVMNMIPFPALDGGRAFFALVEIVRRKPIKPEYEGWVHFVGFAVLLLLMLVVTGSDIMKLFQ